jgi:hypothetical protein
LVKSLKKYLRKCTDAHKIVFFHFTCMRSMDELIRYILPDSGCSHFQASGVAPTLDVCVPDEILSKIRGIELRVPLDNSFSIKEKIAEVCYKQVLVPCFFSEGVTRAFADIRIRVHPERSNTHILVYERCCTHDCRHWHSKLGISICIGDAVAVVKLEPLVEIEKRLTTNEGDEGDDEDWRYERSSMWTVCAVCTFFAACLLHFLLDVDTSTNCSTLGMIFTT